MSTSTQPDPDSDWMGRFLAALVNLVQALAASAVSGSVDSALNPVTFASPEQVALFVGGVVFLLKSLFDVWWETSSPDREKKRKEREERLQEERFRRKYGCIQAEVGFLRLEGREEKADLLQGFLDVGCENGLDPNEIKQRFEKSEKIFY